MNLNIAITKHIPIAKCFQLITVSKNLAISRKKLPDDILLNAYTIALIFFPASSTYILAFRQVTTKQLCCRPMTYS